MININNSTTSGTKNKKKPQPSAPIQEEFDVKNWKNLLQGLNDDQLESSIDSALLDDHDTLFARIEKEALQSKPKTTIANVTADNSLDEEDFKTYCMAQIRQITKLTEESLQLDDLLQQQDGSANRVDVSKLSEFQFWLALFRRQSDRLQRMKTACDERCTALEMQVALLTQQQQQPITMPVESAEDSLVESKLAALKSIFQYNDIPSFWPQQQQQ